MFIIIALDQDNSSFLVDEFDTLPEAEKYIKEEIEDLNYRYLVVDGTIIKRED